MAAPLPYVPNDYRPTNREQDAINRLYTAYQDLKKMGWRGSRPPESVGDFWSIDPGSTGVHYTTKGEPRMVPSFWVCDGDLWPAGDICLWREMAVKTCEKPEAP